VAAAPAATPIVTQRRVDPGRHVAVPTHLKTSHGAAVAPHIAHVREAGDDPVSSAGTDAPKLEATSGGLQAPDEDAATTAGDGTTGAGNGTVSTGTTTASGTTTGANSTTAAGSETTSATGTGTSGATTTTSGSDATTTSGSGGTIAPASPPATVSNPVAQGASAPPAG
jgi:hypothetical protein